MLVQCVCVLCVCGEEEGKMGKGGKDGGRRERWEEEGPQCRSSKL